MEDLLFERLDRMDACVEPEIVLQDLYFVDRMARPMVGPTDPDYRVPYLSEALESRGFITDPEGRWRAIELFDDLCELCDIRSYASLAEVLTRYGAYRSEKAASQVHES